MAKPNERKSDAENCYRGKEVTAQPRADWDFEYLLMVIVWQKRTRLWKEKCLDEMRVRISCGTCIHTPASPLF